jgi:methylmalonyl-CoA mutase N-terminal domain/subunit
VTIQALAAVLGGTQSLHTNSKDEAHSLPTEESVRTALRTQQVLAHESGVADTIDPLAGSYYIESLTDKIERDALALIDKIDDAGGVVKCIEEGFIQRQIENAAYQYQQEIERGERIIVGVNKFQVQEEKKPPLLRVDPEVEKNQIAKLKEIKNNRNNEQVANLLANLETAARGSENLMPHIYDCVKEYASLGEICNVLRKVFGEYKDRG